MDRDMNELPPVAACPDSLPEDYLVLRVGWVTQTPGMEVADDRVRMMFRVLIDFLQDNGLTTRQILAPNALVADDIEIRLRDLTREGDLLMRRPQDRWIGKVDGGMDPSDTTILEKALAKIRAGKAGKYGE